MSSLSTEKGRDKLFSIIAELELKERRKVLLEQGLLIECSGVGKRAGIEYPVAMTRGLWRELYPHGEDAAKGVTFDEILWDIFKLFKKEVTSNPHAKGYMEFAILAKTYVKKYISHDKVETFKDGKPRDKRIEVMTTFLPTETGEPSLVFGLKSARFL